MVSGVPPVPGNNYEDQGGPPKPAEFSSGGGAIENGGLQNGKANYVNEGHHQGSGGGACQCVPVEYCQNRGGSHGGNNGHIIGGGGKDTGLDGEYGPGDGNQGGTNPSKDGAGVIDIRIVNRVRLVLFRRDIMFIIF